MIDLRSWDYDSDIKKYLIQAEPLIKCEYSKMLLL